MKGVALPVVARKFIAPSSLVVSRLFVRCRALLMFSMVSSVVRTPPPPRSPSETIRENSLYPSLKTLATGLWGREAELS